MLIFNFYFINFILEKPFVLLGFQFFFLRKWFIEDHEDEQWQNQDLAFSSYYTNDANGKKILKAQMWKSQSFLRDQLRQQEGWSLIFLFFLYFY